MSTPLCTLRLPLPRSQGARTTATLHPPLLYSLFLFSPRAVVVIARCPWDVVLSSPMGVTRLRDFSLVSPFPFPVPPVSFSSSSSPSNEVTSSQSVFCALRRGPHRERKTTASLPVPRAAPSVLLPSLLIPPDQGPLSAATPAFRFATVFLTCCFRHRRRRDWRHFPVGWNRKPSGHPAVGPRSASSVASSTQLFARDKVLSMFIHFFQEPKTSVFFLE